MNERRVFERDRQARPGPHLEVKFLGDPGLVLSGEMEFEGYASLFDIPDLGRDVVLRGAFAESLARRGAGGVRMLWQHDPAEPIGRWLSIVEDRRGLRVRGSLNPVVGRARELAALLREGAIDGLSIGFRVVEAERDRARGLRRLIRADLWEISLVTFPMLPGARVEARPEAIRAASPLSLAIRRAARRLSQPAALAASARTR